MRKFYYDGRSSIDFGMVISGSGTFGAPQRDVETVSVPGRNGDLIIDNGRYLNTTVTYPVSICRDFAEKAQAARGWLLSGTGYKRLEDDYHPHHFRLGAFTGPIDFDVKFLNRIGETSLKFNCKPQRFLKQGEFPVEATSGTYLHNPTAFPAMPLITIYGPEAGIGSGYVTISGVYVAVKSISDQIILDCELQDAYRHVGDGATENMNNCIYAPKFPVLQPGDNIISFGGQVSGVTIIPRWWEL